MKNILFLVGLLFLTCCSQNENRDIQSLPSNELSTQCYLSRGGSDYYALQQVNVLTTTNIEDAYFYLRVDNRIPGAGSYPINQYYPLSTTGKSVQESYNKGSIDNSLDWSTDDNGIKYIYDTTGKASIKPIIKQPDLDELLKKSNINVSLKGLKVIWYITKFESGFWHVDGVLTYESTKDITDIDGVEEDKNKENRKDNSTDDITKIDGQVEVDIHQQSHTDWDETKTSVHIRAGVNSVEINIPIGSEYICESDDTNIRYYEYFGSAKDITTSKYVQVAVDHSSDNIKISISVDPEYVQSLMNETGDGITVEIHNYIKDLTKEDIWEKIKRSTVKTYKTTTIVGQVTSAFYADKIDIVVDDKVNTYNFNFLY